MPLLWTKFLFYTSWRNLLRSPRRTAIILLVIASASSAMLIFQSFVDGVKSTFRRNVITSVYAHYQIYPKGHRNHLDDAAIGFNDAEAKKLREDIEAKIGKLVFFSRRLPFYGLINFNDRSVGGVGFGTESAEERKFLTLMQVHAGRHLADSGEDAIFIGYKLADRLRVKPGDMVTVLVTSKSGSLNALDLEVVGTFETGITELDQGTYQVQIKAAQNLLRTESTPLVLLGFANDNELPYQKPLEQYVAEEFPEFELAHWKTLAEFFENTMGWIEKQVFVFRWIILMIATISIVTVFFMGLFERTGEFGTMRAIGTHRVSIASMILIESLVQATLGVILGIGVAAIAIYVFLVNGIYMPPPPLMNVPFHVEFKMPWDNLFSTAMLCVAVSGGAGIFPAIKISRLGIAQALGRNI